MFRYFLILQITSDLSQFKSFIDVIMNVGIGVAGLLSGYRIFQSFNRGEDVTSDIIRWVGGLFLGYSVYSLAAYFLFARTFNSGNYLSPGIFIEFGNDVWIYGLYISGLIVLIGFIRLYNKYMKGQDDLYEFSLRWFGSILFLFSIGYIIFLLRTGTY